MDIYRYSLVYTQIYLWKANNGLKLVYICLEPVAVYDSIIIEVLKNKIISFIVDTYYLILIILRL